LLLREITNDVTCLNDELADDLKIPEVVTSVTALCEVMSGQINAKGKQIQILETYTSLRVDLGAADPHLGTALDLGRMLADTVILPVSVADYQAEFNKFRLANAYGWLEDLHTYFPKYASDTVRGSLEFWQGWMSQYAETITGEEAERVRRALTRQGEKWRRILSGEILAEELLTADDYREAASHFLRRLRDLIWSFVRSFWPVALPIALVAAAVIVAIIKYAPGGTASVFAFVATAAGILGVSWKTVSSTLGKVASNAEQPLWRAEVLESIVMAATVLPADMNRRRIMSLRNSAREAESRLGKPAAADAGQHAPAVATAPSAAQASAPAPRSSAAAADGARDPAI
jgi:hypothetical protein